MMSQSRMYDDDEVEDEEEDSGSDSDIQEVIVIPANSKKSASPDEPFHPAKRRKSSPQLDPIPSYEPTPLHILEQRSKDKSNSTIDSTYLPSYTPTPISTAYSPEYSTESTSSHSRDSSRSGHNDYVPLLKPSPCVVGRTTVGPEPRVMTRSKNRLGQPTRTPPANRASAFRPVVSGALAQAVARRRNSLNEQSSDHTGLEAIKTNEEANLVEPRNADEPVMWSPLLPSQIPPVKDELAQKQTEEEYAKYKSPRITKQRVAHKPTVPQNKQKRPRAPLGTSKKVPQTFRVKYLDVIINEYLNTGHPEDEAYESALKEEQALATRAANKSIYINLVAGLKKKIREQAGVSTLPPDEDPKFVNGNKVVSHSEIITGKVTGTFSIERKRKSSDPADLNEEELYDRLLRYLVPIEELEVYGYPMRDPDEPTLRKAPLGKDGQKLQLRDQIASSYTCERCTKLYRVEENGLPVSTTGKCIYHPGHLWNERIARALEKRYSCCKGDPSAGGCSSNPYHVHKGELELANYKGFVETKSKPERDPNKHGIFALDCEMCYTTVGLELTRVTVINYKYDVVYEKLVKPSNPILDYNTKFSGIKEGDLDKITTSITDVQQDLLDMFSSKTILVGHSLDSDMKALKIFHQRFIDTAQLFPHKRGLPFKRALRTLMVENLRVIIQEDVGHDSKEDASAAFRLVMWKAKTDVPDKTSKINAI